MARARNIKPGFFSNEDLVELPFGTRLLFIGLWTIADRAGRLEDRPKRIKMALFPADDLDVNQALNDLQAMGFLIRYEVDGARFIQVTSFEKHQNPHRDEKASAIPAPCGHDASTVQAACEEDAAIACTLNPDSPNPDSLHPVGQRATPVSLSMAMKAGGFTMQPADPRLIALAEQGTLPETVTAACADAKKSKPDDPNLKAGYVVAILERWAREARAVNVAGARPPQARASPGRPEKFDPVAHVNRNRNQPHERTINFDASGEPV